MKRFLGIWAALALLTGVMLMGIREPVEGIWYAALTCVLPPLPLAAAIAVGLAARAKNRELEERVRQLEISLYQLPKNHEKGA